MGATIYPVIKAVGLVAATTLGLLVVEQVLPLGQVSAVFLLPVLICATRWGLVPALVAVTAGVLADDFFFIKPLYALEIDNPEDVVDLVLFAIVAVVTSNLAARLRVEVGKSHEREQEIGSLYGFLRKLTASFTPSDIYNAIQHHLSTNLRTRVVLIGATEQDGAGMRSLDRVDVPEAVRREAFGLLETRDPHPRTVTDELNSHVWLVRAVSARTIDLGVIAIDLGNRSRESSEAIQRGIDAILVDATATLERLDVARRISEANVRAQAELLQEALIGSVSHELRTPLSSVLGAATVLSSAGAVRRDPQLSELAQMIRDQAEQLDSDIQNLLDAARISNDGVRPHVEWTDPVDVVNAAVERKRRRLATHRLDLELADDLPLVQMDAVLVEQALGQILENAAKYSASGSTIRVRAYVEHKRVLLSVRDEGSGLTADEKNRIWLRSYRSPRHADTVMGSGLGLWIAHAFIKANDGELYAASDGGGNGTTISVSFPVSHDAILELANGADE